MNKKVMIENEQQMLALAKRLAKVCDPPLVVYLSGELGAGKTTFSRGFLEGLGYQGRVKSPTYTLVEHYPFSNLQVFHFDLYRIHDPQELELMGIRDYFTEKSLCLIEWPEQGGSYLHSPDIQINFIIEHSGRRLEFSTLSEHGDKIVQKMLGQTI
jgi:tRNA threonylcarbamoyladenosine biosynthesis protein TsaE